MPFVRVTRDRRGYETIYLVHSPERRGRSAPARVLYAFRTPPGTKVGRDPFDADLRLTLETRYPDIRFDWTVLSKIPAPPPDIERWRERRRAERAAKQARRAEELGETADQPGQGDVEPPGLDVPPTAAHDAAAEPMASSPEVAGHQPQNFAPNSSRGRRRRGRRRSRAGPSAGAPDVLAAASDPTSKPGDPPAVPPGQGAGNGEPADP